MLVSSIGYFSVNKTVGSNNALKDRAVDNVSLGEGFGYSTSPLKQNKNSSVLKSLIAFFKSLFMKKNDDSSKYLSLIA